MGAKKWAGTSACWCLKAASPGEGGSELRLEERRGVHQGKKLGKVFQTGTGLSRDTSKQEGTWYGYQMGSVPK